MQIHELPAGSPASGLQFAGDTGSQTQKIDYDALADAILSKLTTKTFDIKSESQTIIAALNALGDASKQGVANNLVTTAAGLVLDARQGKALDDKITSLNSSLGTYERFDLTLAYTSTGNVLNSSYGIYFGGIGLVVLFVNLYDANGDIPKLNNPILTVPSKYRPKSGVATVFTVSSTFPSAQIERGGIDMSYTNIVLNNFATGAIALKFISGILMYKI